MEIELNNEQTTPSQQQEQRKASHDLAAARLVKKTSRQNLQNTQTDSSNSDVIGSSHATSIKIGGCPCKLCQP